MKKYIILGLVILNNMFNQAIPGMALSVLLKDISFDLNMDLVQAGYLWGSPQILAIFSAFFGGAIADWVGERKILIYGSYALGVLGFAKFLGWDYSSIFVITLLFGFFTPLTMVANFKLLQRYFDEKELSFANGLMSAGMALGFLIGAWVSATFLAPLVGGWRGVFAVYGIISLIFPTIFIFLIETSDSARHEREAFSSVLSTLTRSLKSKHMWLLGLGLFGINSAIQAYLGYLPTYLQNIGWKLETASLALTIFHLASLTIAILVAIYSKRLRGSRTLTVVTSVFVFAGILLTTFARGQWIWPTVILAGIFRDAYMAMLFTYATEVGREVKIATGAAIGFVMMMNGIGNVIAPPLGNSFAAISPTAPYLVWSGMAFVGVVSVVMIRDKKTGPIDQDPVW